MRQRGPTATVLSPGLYSDAVARTNPHHEQNSDNLSANLTSDTMALNPPPGVFVTTLAPGMASMTPVLTPLQTTFPSVFPSSNDAHQTRDKKDGIFHKKCLNTNMEHVRPHRHENNIPKRNKTQRHNHLFTNGYNPADHQNRKLQHSLKMTIRRTSQAHKVHSTHPHPAKHGLTNGCNSVNKSGVDAIDPSVVENRSNDTDLDTPISHPVSQGTSTVDIVTATEPDLLGPCEAGTKVVVEGVVWLETTGMLVLNIQWRGRAYCGTLMDATRQNYAPSCPDKGVTSALSLLRGRRAWPLHTSPRGGGRFRNSAGVHHFHQFHHHHHHFNHHHRHRLHGGSMTTRSAAAAAAALNSTVDSATNKQEKSFVDVYALPTDAELPLPSTQPRTGGGKRRKRRGNWTGQKYRRTAQKSKPPTTTDFDTFENNSPQTLPDDQKPLDDTRLKEPSPSPSVPCPFPGCTKCFSDLLSMRYHVSMGHTAQSDTQTEPITISLPSKQSAQSPPALGRAHSIKEQVSDESNESTAAFHMDVDNLAPPRLQRIASITESIADDFPHPGCITSSPTSKPTSPGGLSDEPPAPSPAYSDISDEGTVPAEQSSSLLSQSTTSSTMFPPGSLSGTFTSRQFVGALEQKQQNSPSNISVSPILTHSPLIRPGSSQNGYFFPINLLPNPSGTATSLSPSTTVSSNSSPSVMPVACATSKTPLIDRLHSDVTSNLPLSTYSPHLFQSFPPAPTSSYHQATLGNILSPHPPVCIPGVHSVSSMLPSSLSSDIAGGRNSPFSSSPIAAVSPQVPQLPCTIGLLPLERMRHHSGSTKGNGSQRGLHKNFDSNGHSLNGPPTNRPLLTGIPSVTSFDTSKRGHH